MVSARIILVSSLSLIALAVRAAEEKEKAADDALVATKRELETMRSEHLRPGGNAPQLQLPDAFDSPLLPSTASGLQPFSSSRTRQQEELLKSKGRSKNWLAEGVQKNSTPTARDSVVGQRNANDSPRASGEQGASDDEIDPIMGRPSESDNTSNDPTKNVSKDDRKSRAQEAKSSRETPPDNPLNRYMGDWMSSQDYALLKKSGDAGPNVRADIPSNDSNLDLRGNSGTSFSPSVPASSSGFNSTSSNVSAASNAPKENPYLSLLSPTNGTSASTASGPLELSNFPANPPPPPPPSFVPLGPAPDPRPASAAQENSKRSDDTKYFPQLKRF